LQASLPPWASTPSSSAYLYAYLSQEEAEFRAFDDTDADGSFTLEKEMVCPELGVELGVQSWGWFFFKLKKILIGVKILKICL
jgi:hypothetical protein